MKSSTSLLSVSIAVFVLGALGAAADEAANKGIEFLNQTGWFKSSTPIQELRERSTKTFELLDENSSGSITIDEIHMPETELDVSEMDPDELRENRQKMRAISSKFMRWSEDIEEFKVVDTNNDGYWSEDEFEARTENLNRHRLELGIAQWDKDGNSAVELHEFNSHLDTLESLDEDGDGTVSREEAFKSENRELITDVLMQQLQFDTMLFGSLDRLRGMGMKELRTLPGAGAAEVRIIHRTKMDDQKAN